MIQLPYSCRLTRSSATTTRHKPANKSGCHHRSATTAAICNGFRLWQGPDRRHLVTAGLVQDQKEMRFKSHGERCLSHQDALAASDKTIRQPGRAYQATAVRERTSPGRLQRARSAGRLVQGCPRRWPGWCSSAGPHMAASGFRHSLESPSPPPVGFSWSQTTAQVSSLRS